METIKRIYTKLLTVPCRFYLDKCFFFSIIYIVKIDVKGKNL